MPSYSLDNRSIVMYWASEAGILEGYTAHARFKVSGEVTSFTFSKSVIIPSGATKLRVYAQNTTSGVLSDEYVEVALPSGASMENKAPDYSFFIVSDIHIGKASTSAVNFQKMLREAISLKPNGTPIFIVGDMADHGYRSELEDMMTLYREVMSEQGKSESDYPLFLTLGNHDYPTMAGTFLEYATLPDGSHPTDTSYDFWLNGYHYIFLGSDTNSGLYANLSDETLAWLDARLSESRDTSRPTFVFLHQPMYNTVSGSLEGEGWDGVLNEEKLREVLKKYPEVMMFNGHTHWTMDSVGNIFEGTEDLPIHIFNCASVSYLWSGYNTVTGTGLDGSQGYFIEICDGEVIVRGRDFVNGEWISAAQYTVEMISLECGDHLAEMSALKYENGYLKEGIATFTCKECGVIYTEKADPLYIFSGYSVREGVANSICVGYTVNYELAALYEILNETEIVFGITATGYDNLVNEGKPINSDGTVSKTVSGAVVNYTVQDGFRFVNLQLRASDWSEYADTKIILCAYIIENGEVSYLCADTATETADYITYNEIISLTE